MLGSYRHLHLHRNGSDPKLAHSEEMMELWLCSSPGTEQARKRFKMQHPKHRVAAVERFLCYSSAARCSWRSAAPTRQHKSLKQPFKKPLKQSKDKRQDLSECMKHCPAVMLLICLTFIGKVCTHSISCFILSRLFWGIFMRLLDGWAVMKDRKVGREGERQRTAGVSQTCTVATCHTVAHWADLA